MARSFPASGRGRKSRKDYSRTPNYSHSMRQTILDLEASRIREVANAGLGRPDVLAFWFGESDEVTPDFIRQAAIDSLHKGETFYAHNLGLPELRQAIAGYTSALHGPVGADRIAVTSGGVNALMLAVQALVDAGDEVVAVTPVWPNLTAQPQIMGARLRTVPLRPVQGAWTLDLPALLAAVTPATRLLVVNAPNNPTGWTLGRAEQQAILDHCRATGTWILADEVYERLYYEDTPGPALGRPEPGAPLRGEARSASGGAGPCAPSFLDIARPDDRLVVAHSFSKSFLMTGWRLGWLVMPPAMTEPMGKLVEFNTSCASVFTQRAALAALARADEVTPRVVAHLKACRDTLVPQLQALPRVRVSPARGGMYAFFQLEGSGDSLKVAKRLVGEAGLGLAPGTAFGPEAQGWLRWCFASRDLDRLSQGVERLRRWLD
ncbi:pyridoxal phosphate-dependent aminotransferase [Ramlibacter tataouinensis]|uniref:Aminotransferase n=1 Tax=Ramlibacter tataouinensis (strain ATCC BAA-407 / DSM 14655 / LMG 21543 / TTB310) TaxID=365046 RepID=F5Y3U4_RAMTT|nr:pyridoxal phosphate-dependent aminotransferase [Ramlibacter tataouinensis]AEG93751.1 aspartate aminotransferase (Transaminase A)-like protein [Ramlibacter tataouinensis TTB310]